MMKLLAYGQLLLDRGLILPLNIGLRIHLIEGDISNHKLLKFYSIYTLMHDFVS
jgi:hypothetical protein